MNRIVKTQAELDQAITDKADRIFIESPGGVWLTLDAPDSSHVVARGSSHVEAWGSSHVEASGSSHVEARGSSHVEARGSSHVEASDSSHVEAWDSSHVVAWDSSHVVARGSSHVVARGSSHVVARDSSHVEARGSSHVVARGSSHVEASDSSHVEAWDSSHVVARGSSHVVAWGSSHVEASDSSHVEAWDSSHVVAWDSSHVVARGSSHVEAWGSSHVEASGSSHVEASSFVAVHLHSQRVELTGGVVIDMTAIDRDDPTTWCNLHGVKVADGIATVFKAVDPEFVAGRQYIQTSYAPGTTPAAGDWRPDNTCGGGLHFGPTPLHALQYHDGDSTTARFLAVGVSVADLRPLDSGGGAPKCKAPRVVTPCVEVDRYGALVVAAVVAE